MIDCVVEEANYKVSDDGECLFKELIVPEAFGFEKVMFWTAWRCTGAVECHRLAASS